MAEVVLNTIFQVKRAESYVWETLNPVLRQGEPGYDLDTGIFKIGDGVTEWLDLKAINSSPVEEEKVNELENIIGKPGEGENAGTGLTGRVETLEESTVTYDDTVILFGGSANEVILGGSK